MRSNRRFYPALRGRGPRLTRSAGAESETARTKPSRRPKSGRFAPLLVLAAALFSCAGTAGCATIGQRIVACPLTYSEQEKEVLAIVPKGTLRADALRRLASAGIEGDFGTSRRIYYCDLWRRANGERWRLNVALFFDESDRLYKTRVADCDVSVVRDGSDNPDKTRGKDAASSPAAKPSEGRRANLAD